MRSTCDTLHRSHKRVFRLLIKENTVNNKKLTLLLNILFDLFSIHLYKFPHHLWTFDIDAEGQVKVDPGCVGLCREGEVTSHYPAADVRDGNCRLRPTLHKQEVHSYCHKKPGLRIRIFQDPVSVAGSGSRFGSMCWKLHFKKGNGKTS